MNTNPRERPSDTERPRGEVKRTSLGGTVDRAQTKLDHDDRREAWLAWAAPGGHEKRENRVITLAESA